MVLHGRRESEFWQFTKHGLSVTAIELWLVCREQFRLRYAEGLRVPRASAALDFGNLWHWMLARAHDKKIKKAMDLEKQLKLVDSEWRDDNPLPAEKRRDDWHLSLAQTRALWPVYQKKFWGDYNRNWIGVELPFETRYETPRVTTRLHGIFDGVFSKPGKSGIWLRETKTKGQIDEYEIEDTLRLDNQVMMYLWVIRMLYGEYPKGVEYNVIRKPATRLKVNEGLPAYTKRLLKEVQRDEDHYFKRWEMAVSQKDLDAWHEHQFRQIIEAIEQWALRDGPHFVNTKALIGKYGRCEMFNIITKGDFTEVVQRKPLKLEKDR